MKTKNLIATLAVIASISVFTSCGDSRTADTSQVKAYVLMTSISKEIIDSYIDEYAQSLEEGIVKDAYVSDVKISYSVGNDMVDKNPWIEKTKLVLKESGWFDDQGQFCYWKLNDEDTEAQYMKTWTRNNNWSMKNIGYLNKRIGELHDITILNQLITYRYAAEHNDDDSIVAVSVIHGYVKFIQKKSNKVVKVYDSYYSKEYSTKSANSYYIIYTIDNDFYVLVRLTEEKKSSRFEVETLDRGNQLIEIERTLKSYL